MTQQAIYLSNTSDENAVVQAFQRALNVVLNPAAIKRLGGRLGYHEYQHVHIEGQPAVGCVSLLLESGQPSGSLFVEIYTSGYRNRARMTYVHPRIARDLEVSIVGTTLSRRLTHDTPNRMYVAQLRAPLGVFKAQPRGLITMFRP